MNEFKTAKTTPKDRIEALSIPVAESGCWIWLSSVSNKRAPYGRLIIGSRSDGTRRTVSAHRYSYETYIGEIPKGMFVCHKCDIPCCVNPRHLFLGNRQDNVNDRETKQRNDISGLSQIGESHHNSKLNWSDIKRIRSISKYRGLVRDLSNQYGVNHKTISDILNFKTWKNEPPETDND